MIEGHLGDVTCVHTCQLQTHFVSNNTGVLTCIFNSRLFQAFWMDWFLLKPNPDSLCDLPQTPWWQKFKKNACLWLHYHTIKFWHIAPIWGHTVTTLWTQSDKRKQEIKAKFFLSLSFSFPLWIPLSLVKREALTTYFVCGVYVSVSVCSGW